MFSRHFFFFFGGWFGSVKGFPEADFGENYECSHVKNPSHGLRYTTNHIEKQTDEILTVSG